MRDLHIAVSLSDGEPALLPDLIAAGVTEIVIVAAPPAEPEAAIDWLDQLASRWIRGLAAHGS